jgi:hypothetical protein
MLTVMSSIAGKNMDRQTTTCSKTYHRSARNTSTSPETTFGAKTRMPLNASKQLMPFWETFR